MTHNNLISLFDHTATKNKNRPCLSFSDNNKWHILTWQETQNRVKKIASGLNQLGINKGDRVAILSKTRYEWTLADLGIMATSGITVPIYESNTAQQAKFILEDSEAKIIFVENTAQMKKILNICEQLPALQHIICFENTKITTAQNNILTLDALITAGADNTQIYETTRDNLTSQDHASFVYTSGTTGNPKGAILTHENFIAEVKACLDICPIQPAHVGLIFLPLAHILGRVTQFFHIHVGHTQVYAESIDRLADNIVATKPHFMVSVPRIFEKIHTRTLQNVQSASANSQKIFQWAFAVGQEYSQALRNQTTISLSLQLKRKLAFALVFKKLYKKMGGRIQFFISGGAPLSPEVALFFHAFGFTILEGYGLTETTAAISSNRSHSIKFGSVGHAISGVAIKLDTDGEILVKGPVVFSGYFKNPEATKEAFDAEGWFHTGDVGTFDSDGFLKITDRKKDIIITAGGKNIAPQNIENHMITDPYISQCIVHGDKRKFLSALIVLDKDMIQAYARKNNIAFYTYEELIKTPQIFSFIRQRIEEKNRELASYETIKKFSILSQDFSIDSGDLTPTLKLKRKNITKKYSGILDALYAENDKKIAS